MITKTKILVFGQLLQLWHQSSSATNSGLLVAICIANGATATAGA